MALDDYLAGIGRWSWGQTDCCQFVRGWVMQARHLDLGFGGYASEIEANRLLAARGGLVRIFLKAARSGGLEKTRSPRRGDVGLIKSENGPWTGAIFGGRRWFVLSQDGIAATTPANFLAWRL